LRHAGAHKPY
jgi:hypothetical protein